MPLDGLRAHSRVDLAESTLVVACQTRNLREAFPHLGALSAFG